MPVALQIQLKVAFMPRAIYDKYQNELIFAKQDLFSIIPAIKFRKCKLEKRENIPFIRSTNSKTL